MGFAVCLLFGVGFLALASLTYQHSGGASRGGFKGFGCLGLGLFCLAFWVCGVGFGVLSLGFLFSGQLRKSTAVLEFFHFEAIQFAP